MKDDARAAQEVAALRVELAEAKAEARKWKEMYEKRVGTIVGEPASVEPPRLAPDSGLKSKPKAAPKK